MRTLVDEVLVADPRIKRIKAEEKAARQVKKGGASTNGAPANPISAAEKQKFEADKAAAEAATKEQEKKAAEFSKVDREAAKKAKEAARKNLKKWKKASLYHTRLRHLADHDDTGHLRCHRFIKLLCRLRCRSCFYH